MIPSHDDDATPNWPQSDWSTGPVDPAAAELREAWTMLGQTLAPTAAPLDEVTAARIVRQVLRREQRRHRRRWGAAALCAAAVLLFLIGKPRLPQNDAPNVVQQDVAPPQVTAVSLAWNDPFDQELAEVREQVLAVEIDWSRADDSFTLIGERLQRLEAEWNESPL